MADIKKISELTELPASDFVVADDMFIVVDKSKANDGDDASDEGKTSKVTFEKVLDNPMDETYPGGTL